MKYSDIRKKAALGWAPDKGTITERFAQLNRERLAQQGALGGLGGSVAAGIAGAYSKPKGPEKLPDFDPETHAYIGQSYKLPETEEAMQALHTKLLGKPWERSAPAFLEWMLAKRPERIRLAISKALKDNPDLGKNLSRGELASLVFPNILKDDGTITDSLGWWRSQPYPAKGLFGDKPITKQDIKEYLAKKKSEEQSKTAAYRHGMDVDKVQALRDKKKTQQLTPEETKYLSDYNAAKEQDAIDTASINALGTAGTVFGGGMTAGGAVRGFPGMTENGGAITGASLGALGGYHLARLLGAGRYTKLTSAVMLSLAGALAGGEVADDLT